MVICRYCDDGPLSEFLFQIVVFPLAVGEVEPPAVIVDHDGYVVRVVEGRRAAVEGRLVEVPFGRGLPPDEPRKVAPVFVVADQAAFGGEIELIPPLELSRRRQGRLAGSLAADQIAADRDQRLAALR